MLPILFVCLTWICCKIYYNQFLNCFEHGFSKNGIFVYKGINTKVLFARVANGTAQSEARMTTSEARLRAAGRALGTRVPSPAVATLAQKQNTNAKT